MKSQCLCLRAERAFVILSLTEPVAKQILRRNTQNSYTNTTWHKPFHNVSLLSGKYLLSLCFDGTLPRVQMQHLLSYCGFNPELIFYHWFTSVTHASSSLRPATIITLLTHSFNYRERIYLSSVHSFTFFLNFLCNKLLFFPRKWTMFPCVSFVYYKLCVI